MHKVYKRHMEVRYMEQKPKKKNRRTVYVDEKTWRFVKSKSALEGLSVSEFICRLIRGCEQ